MIFSHDSTTFSTHYFFMLSHDVALISADNRLTIHSEADADGQTGTRAHIECTLVQAPGGLVKGKRVTSSVSMTH